MVLAELDGLSVLLNDPSQNVRELGDFFDDRAPLSHESDFVLRAYLVGVIGLQKLDTLLGTIQELERVNEVGFFDYFAVKVGSVFAQPILSEKMLMNVLRTQISAILELQERLRSIWRKTSQFGDFARRNSKCTIHKPDHEDSRLSHEEVFFKEKIIEQMVKPMVINLLSRVAGSDQAYAPDEFLFGIASPHTFKHSIFQNLWVDFCMLNLTDQCLEGRKEGLTDSPLWRTNHVHADSDEFNKLFSLDDGL